MKQLTFWQEDTPASLLASMENVKPTETNGICGPTSTVPFAILDPVGFWLKMYGAYCQVKMDSTLEKYSQTWPISGMMRSGMCYQQQPLVLPTKGKDSSLLPTPKKRDGLGFYVVTYETSYKRIHYANHTRHWMNYGCVYHNLRKAWANPRFAELMMGLPIGWTDWPPVAKQ